MTTKAPSSNVEIARAAYDAYVTKDRAALEAFLAKKAARVKKVSRKAA